MPADRPEFDTKSLPDGAAAGDATKTGGAGAGSTFPPEARGLLGDLGPGGGTLSAGEPGAGGPPPNRTQAHDGSRVPAPPTAPAVPGYEVTGTLGHGGMGVVYKAVQVRLKRTVALKVVLGGGHASPGAVARFQAEAEAVAALHHPNVVQVYDAGEAAGLPYLAMEFAPGGSLKDKLAAGPLPVGEAVRLVQQLAKGVAAAHAAGIVHRDLKPGNVLFAADGTPKVADFGLAKRADAAGPTLTGDVLGSPSYMAPEQAEGRVKEVGPATDVYALGTVLYECLTGRQAFAGDSVLTILDGVRSGRFTPVRRARPDVPPAVEAVVRRCLAKRPADRYPSADAVADALSQAGAHRPARGRRGWAAALAAGCGLTAAAAGLAVVLRTGGDSRGPAEVAARVGDRPAAGPEVLPPPRRVPAGGPPGRADTTRPGVAARPRGGDRHALLVGVREYALPSYRRTFGYTERDVDELARALVRHWGFGRADIRLQTQWTAAENPSQAPTGANIRRQLARMRDLPEPGDTVVVGLTGTGVQTGDPPRYHFLPEDGDPDRPGALISEDELFAAFARCRAEVKLLVVDTCRSAWPRGRPAGGRAAAPAGTVVLYGCSPGQKSYEFDDIQHGVMSYAVLQGLRGQADADGDGAIDLAELTQFVTREVKTRMTGRASEGKQTPEVVTALPPGAVLFTRKARPLVSRSLSVAEADPPAPPPGAAPKPPSVFGD